MLYISLIPGFMFGIEWQYNYKFFAIDLGIFRIMVDYGATFSNASQEVESHQSPNPPEQQ